MQTDPIRIPYRATKDGNTDDRFPVVAILVFWGRCGGEKPIYIYIYIYIYLFFLNVP